MLSNTRVQSESNTPVTGMSNWLGDGKSPTIKIGHGFTTTSERTLESHEHLFMVNDVQTQIYQVLDGVIGVYNMLSDGRRQIVTFYYPGDLIGVEDTGHWMYHAEALCRVRVRSIPVTTIDTLLHTEPRFGQAMLATLATELAETRDQLLSLGRKSALEKVATFLLRISRRNQREGRDAKQLYLPMTRTEIGDYLGLTIETVSRNFTRLKTAGVIKLHSKSDVQVDDISALEKLAEGDQ